MIYLRSTLIEEVTCATYIGFFLGCPTHVWGDVTHLEFVISSLDHFLALGSWLEGCLSPWTMFDLFFTHFWDIGTLIERAHFF
jgi:hypothetical protein